MIQVAEPRLLIFRHPEILRFKTGDVPVTDLPILLSYLSLSCIIQHYLHHLSPEPSSCMITPYCQHTHSQAVVHPEIAGDNV